MSPNFANLSKLIWYDSHWKQETYGIWLSQSPLSRDILTHEILIPQVANNFDPKVTGSLARRLCSQVWQWSLDRQPSYPEWNTSTQWITLLSFRRVLYPPPYFLSIPINLCSYFWEKVPSHAFLRHSSTRTLLLLEVINFDCNCLYRMVLIKITSLILASLGCLALNSLGCERVSLS